MTRRFPNETAEFRMAREVLLARDIARRREIEAVAAELRALPPGCAVLEDYRFETVGAD